MDRMKNVHYEITGNKWKDEDEDLDGMTPFDAQKYILAKKLGHIREVTTIYSLCAHNHSLLNIENSSKR
jgi:hypothetical protein